MLSIEQLPDDVTSAIAQALGIDWDCEKGAPEGEQRMRELIASEAFDLWCTWQGFLGWSATIVRTLDAIRAAHYAPPPADTKPNDMVPDTLAALEALLTEVDEMVKRVGWAGNGGRDKARAAIEKARGSA